MLRGDNEPITVGENSNVQDGCVLHTDPGSPLEIGPNVTIGHMVMLHGCVIGEGSLVGIGAVVLNGAKIGKHCLIGANALVTENAEIPDYSMVLGSPAKSSARWTKRAPRAWPNRPKLCQQRPAVRCRVAADRVVEQIQKSGQGRKVSWRSCGTRRASGRGGFGSTGGGTHFAGHRHRVG